MAGPRRWMTKTLMLLLLATWRASGADAPEPAAPADPPPRMPRADGEPMLGDDGLRLPPDAKAVVLPRDKYQELLDEVARLRDQLKPAKPLAPSFCDLSGQVDGNLVRLHAQFKFRTERDYQRVTLGCAGGSPTDAKLDGQLPNFTKTTDNGFVVQADKAGEHKFLLDLEILVSSNENERAFTLDLPGAAVTTLELDLPEGVRAARVGSDTLKAEPMENKRNRVKGPLGPLQKLDVAWTLPASGTPQPPSLAAEVRISVRVEDTQVVTEAELTLKALRGEPTEWLLYVPPQAEMRKQGLDERIQSVMEMDARRLVRVVKLTGPSSKELKIAFQVRQPRENKLIPVGPFVVPGAVRQQGTLTVSAPTEVNLIFHPRSDLSPRPVSDEERRREPNVAAAFRYASLASLEKPLVSLNQPAPPLLGLEVEPIKGEVEAHVRYDLRLVKADGERRPYWRLATTVDATAYRARAEQLQIQLPPGFQFDPRAGVQPAEFVLGPEINPATHIAHFTLLNKKPDRFQVVFHGTYPPLEEDEHTATLEVPQCLGVMDLGAVVTLNVTEDLKLLAPQLPGWREPMILEPHKQTWRYDQTPVRIRVDWQATRPDSIPAGLATPQGVLHVERALVQATVGSSGYQNCWAWFLIKPNGNKTVDIDLPAPAAGLNVKASLDGKPVQSTVVDESGKAVEVGKILRVTMAAADDTIQCTLKIAYQLPPIRAGGSGLLQTALQAPAVRGESGWTPVRWQVSLPSGWLPLDVDAGFRVEQGWRMRGWLVGPRPIPSEPDSEGWSMGAVAANMPLAPDGEAAGPMALIGWQSSPGPIRLTHAPQQAWLLACSLTVLALGLAAGFLKGPRGIAWILGLGLALAIAALALFWPHVLTVLIYGSEPGAVVLLLVFGTQWLLHQRYRQQVVFLPGFQRGKSGSSLQRVGSGSRPRVEPTTVDAPSPVDSGARPTGSAVKPAGGSAKTGGDSRNR